MNFLTDYGWNNFHEQYFNPAPQNEFQVGRVIAIKGFKFELMTVKGELDAELSGRLLYGTSPEDLPKVGDWVRYLDYDQVGYIVDVFPRKNFLSRKNPGNTMEKQILGSNIDRAFVVQGLDRDFNLMRLDRYLVQLASCNIPAAVVLNKCDLVEDLMSFRKEIEKLGRGVDVFFCSTYSGFGIRELRDIITANHTFILIGSSGVGKSSLLNALMQSQTQVVNATSESTSKGKHTTTNRELFKLDNGGLIIDTPGMREFGVTFEESSMSANLFPAIAAFAGDCRYTDCRHVNEAGCAVILAVEEGKLEQDVYTSYLKLLKEQRRFEISAEDKKREGKEAGRRSREANDFRKKFKY